MFLINSGNSKRGLLIIIISLLMLAGFVFTNAVNFYYLKLNLRNSIIETELPKATTEVYSEITLNVLPAIIASSMLANDRFIQRWLQNNVCEDEDLVSYLAQIKHRSNALISFVVSFESQQYFNSEGVKMYESEDDPQAAWYFDFVNSDKMYELNVGPNIDSSHTPALFVNYKIFHEDQLLGVVGLGLKFDVIKNILQQFKHNHNQNIYFLDAHGHIISHSEGAMLDSKAISNLPTFSDALSNANQHDSTILEYQNEHGKFLLNLQYIAELNWWMLIEQEEEITFSEIRTILYTNLFIGLVTIIVILIIVSWVVNFFHKQLEAMATTDALTQLNNRAAFEYQAKKALLQSERSSTPISVLMIDIDKFKDINDKYGHLKGDQVLQTIATNIDSSTRQSDCVSRWGGEEFVVLAHNSDIDSATILAEKIRARIENCHSFPQPITISVGVTQAVNGDSLDHLLARADIALYQSKNNGRNCVRTVQAEE